MIEKKSGFDAEIDSVLSKGVSVNVSGFLIEADIHALMRGKIAEGELPRDAFLRICANLPQAFPDLTNKGIAENEAAGPLLRYFMWALCRYKKYVDNNPGMKTDEHWSALATAFNLPYQEVKTQEPGKRLLLNEQMEICSEYTRVRFSSFDSTLKSYGHESVLAKYREELQKIEDAEAKEDEGGLSVALEALEEHKKKIREIKQAAHAKADKDGLAAAFEKWHKRKFESSADSRLMKRLEAFLERHGVR